MDDSSRRCQDIICCLIFIAFLIGMVIVTILGFSQGNPNLVLYPYDEDGNQCGFNTLVTHPYLYFYAAVSNFNSLNVTAIAQGVCVTNCPQNFTGSLECKPTTKNKDCKVSELDFYVSTDFLGRFCVPDPSFSFNNTGKNDTIVVEGQIYRLVPNDTQSSANSLINLKIINTDKLISWMSDLITTWPILLASLGFSLVVVIFYMILVQWCAGFIAYMTILLILASLAGLGYLFQSRIEYYQNINDETYTLTMKVLCGLCYSLAGLWLLIILFMCNRIRLAIELVEITAKYVKDTWSIFIVPIIFYIISGCFYGYWVALSIYLYSSGEVSKSNGSFLPEVIWTSTTRYAWWYHLFALFYINAFLDAYSQFVLSSSACIWYWTPPKSSPDRPVYRSFFRAGRYHLGSLAFGSLIVAIIKFCVAILQYIKQKVDVAGVNDHSAKIYKCFLTCCQCFLTCCAKCIEFINKHAYIQIALKGDNFCVSAFEGFGLVFRNFGRFSMLFLIGGFFNLIGILFISSGTGVIGYLLITRIDRFSIKLISPVIPTFVMVFIGFIVGTVYIGIYGVSSDAMMHCFLLEEELYDGVRIEESNDQDNRTVARTQMHAFMGRERPAKP